ncbi:hypothetical protein PRIPAC_79712, partial [Pristionchus pacificus]|uniref:G protein-coupled receptor n=1 Tax=Pristionchus pacificus TaxID=54126 RepID=A0A2A6C2P7_PRIPA
MLSIHNEERELVKEIHANPRTKEQIQKRFGKSNLRLRQNFRMSTNEEEFLAIDERSSVDILLRLECKYCEQGFDGDEHTPFLSPCGHLYCDECLQDNSDESIECPCGTRFDAEDAMECFALKSLFHHLSTVRALRCSNCERLHPIENSVRLIFENDQEHNFCVWCAFVKLIEDASVIAVHFDEDIKDVSRRPTDGEMMSSLGEEGIEIMRTIVCCCLCERRIPVKRQNNLQQEMRKAAMTAIILPFTIIPSSPTDHVIISAGISSAQALQCGHFVCSQRCLSKNIDHNNISCCFCDMEIEEDGIRSDSLNDLLVTASAGEKCAVCLKNRSTKDLCFVDQETKCVWCMVQMKTAEEIEEYSVEFTRSCLKMNVTLRFGWEVDLILMDFIFWFQWIIESFVILLHLTIFMILKSQETLIAVDIKLGYTMDQVAMVFFGWTICYIIKMYPIYPWPGFYCEGILCIMIPDVPMWCLMSLSALAIISVVPFFQYLTFRMYTHVMSLSTSPFLVGQRTQFFLLTMSTSMLAANVIAFGIFSKEPPFVQYLYNEPEMNALLNSRGGRIIMFGIPGDPSLFRYGTQIICVAIFYVVPLIFLLDLMIIDTSNWPEWALAVIRPVIIILLSLKSTVQSMIFLLKNPNYTKRVFVVIVDSIRCRKSSPLVSNVQVVTNVVDCQFDRLLKESNRIGAYRNLVGCFCLSDLYYTMIHWLVYPIPETYNNAFAMKGHRDTVSNPHLLQEPLGFFAAFFSTTCPTKLIGLCVLYFLFSPDEQSMAVLAPFFAGNSSSPVIHNKKEAHEYMQALYWAGETFDQPRWRDLIGAFIMAVIIIIAYVVIVTSCIARISGEMNKCNRSNEIKHSDDISAYNDVLSSRRISFNSVSVFCPPFCVSHPLFDPLVLIFCIPEYSKTFLRDLGLSRFDSKQDFSRALQYFITNAVCVNVFIALSLIVNLMLLRILRTSRRSAIGAYRYLIMWFCLSDLYYTIIHWQIPETFHNSFLLKGHGLFHSRLGPCIYAAAYLQAFPILAFHFVYRTLAIRNLFVSFVLFAPDEQSMNVLGPFFAGNFSSPVVHNKHNAHEYLQAVYWAGETFEEPRWRNLIGALIVIVIIVIAYIMIVTCCFLIKGYLKSHAKSTRAILLHRQLFRSLICQTVYPLITTYYLSTRSLRRIAHICFSSFAWNFSLFYEDEGNLNSSIFYFKTTFRMYAIAFSTLFLLLYAIGFIRSAAMRKAFRSLGLMKEVVSSFNGSLNFSFYFSNQHFFVILHSKTTQMSKDMRIGYIFGQTLFRLVRYSKAAPFAISSKCILSFLGPGTHYNLRLIQLSISDSIAMVLYAVFECSLLGHHVHFCLGDRISCSILPVPHFIDILKSVASTIILLANTVAFGAFAVEPEFMQELHNVPEVAALLNSRGGRVIMFGHPGQPGQSVSAYTHELENRLEKVLFSQ